MIKKFDEITDEDFVIHSERGPGCVTKVYSEDRHEFGGGMFEVIFDSPDYPLPVLCLPKPGCLGTEDVKKRTLNIVSEADYHKAVEKSKSPVASMKQNSLF